MKALHCDGYAPVGGFQHTFIEWDMLMKFDSTGKAFIKTGILLKDGFK